MEDWQQQHIKENFDQLTSRTTCSTSVITHLWSKNVLSQDELETLEGIHVRNVRSSQLYRILLTRINGYDELLSILKEQNQSGACDILEKGILEKDPFRISNRIVHEDTPAELNKTNFFKGKFAGRDVDVKLTDIKQANLLSIFFAYPDIKVNGMLNAVWNEVNLLMKSDSHENIIRYLTTEIRGLSAIIAFEQCERKLEDWINNPVERGAILTGDLLRQVTSGVKHLHLHKIIHGNLNPQNILLRVISNDEVRVKLADFKTGKSVKPGDLDYLENDNAIVYMEQNLWWMAPELLTFIDLDSISTHLSPDTHRAIRANVTMESDIFSLGCIFFIVLNNGDHPFGTRVYRVDNIIGNHPVKTIRTRSSLIPLMIHHNPLERPAASRIVEENIFE